MWYLSLKEVMRPRPGRRRFFSSLELYVGLLRMIGRCLFTEKKLRRSLRRRERWSRPRRRMMGSMRRRKKGCTPVRSASAPTRGRPLHAFTTLRRLLGALLRMDQWGYRCSMVRRIPGNLWGWWATARMRALSQVRLVLPALVVRVEAVNRVMVL